MHENATTLLSGTSYAHCGKRSHSGFSQPLRLMFACFSTGQPLGVVDECEKKNAFVERCAMRVLSVIYVLKPRRLYYRFADFGFTGPLVREIWRHCIHTCF